MGTARAVAQPQTTDTLLLRDYGMVKDADSWLTGRNAAALTRYNQSSISVAEAYGAYQKGGFVNYDGAPRQLQAGASVESFYRISQRIVMSGMMSYDNVTGRDMTGSAFVNTTRLPFDITENTLENAGKKHRDTYRLSGGMGVELWKGVSVGAKADFTAANYAKYKDLRHKTKLMDLDVTAGVYAPIGRYVGVGANYEYRRSTQTVRFSTYAGSAQDYESFVNYGPWIGEVVQFGNDGMTNSSLEMPLVSEYQGFGVQVEVRPSRVATWYNEFNMAYRDGYYGRKSPYTITYTGHSSHLYGYRTRLQWRERRNVHNVDFAINSENLVNRMNTYREQTNASGAMYYQYFDPVKSANRLWTDTHIGYTGYWNVRQELPLWTVKAGLNMGRRRQTGYDYPYYRQQKLSWTEGYAKAERNIILRRGVLNVGVSLAYQKGSGDVFDDETFVLPSDKQKGSPVMDEFLYREYDWLAAPRRTVGGSVKYSFVFPKTRLNTYIAAEATHTKANWHDDYLPGSDRMAVGMKIGCVF